MTRTHSPLLAILLLGLSSAPHAQASDVVDVYKSPYCGCCEKWVEHMRRAGFEVRTHEVSDIPGTRKQLGMPEQLGACHTAKVAGYLVEGHVPAADIKRLLKEKPKAIGLAVPSMPPGSPGMEGAKPMPYNTLLVKNSSDTEIFAKH